MCNTYHMYGCLNEIFFDNMTLLYMICINIIKCNYRETNFFFLTLVELKISEFLFFRNKCKMVECHYVERTVCNRSCDLPEHVWS